MTVQPSKTGPGSVVAEKLQRARSPYTRKEKTLRVLWWLFGQPLMRLSLHTWYRPRAAWLRLFGARIGSHTRIRPSVRIEQPWNLSIGDNSSIGDRAELYCLGSVTIGANVSISQRAYICAGTHDFDKPDMPLIRPPVAIEDDAWIAADAFVGPGVTVGRGAVLGARGCAFKDLEAWAVYGGNPAAKLRGRQPAVESGANEESDEQ